MVDCEKILNKYYNTKTPVYQEFQINPEKSSHEIEECFDDILINDNNHIILNHGYQMDCLLFYLINDPELIKINILIDECLDYDGYQYPLMFLSQTITPNKSYYNIVIDIGLNTYENQLLTILIYQIYVLIFNFANKFPLIYQKQAQNTESLIGQILMQNNFTWESLFQIFSTQSSGFEKFHNNIIFSDYFKSLNRLQTSKDCIKILGLYMAYQIAKHGQDVVKPIAGQVNYSQNPYSFNLKQTFNLKQKFNLTTVSKHVEILFQKKPPKVKSIKPNKSNQLPVKVNTKPIIVATKTPFKIVTALNTFDLPTGQLEVNVTPLNQLTIDTIYEPISNLLSLSELETHLQNEAFIQDIIKSELKLMSYKFDRYLEMKKDIDNNLNQSGLEAEIKQQLETKQKIVQVVLDMSKKRIDEIQKLDLTQQIKNKRAEIDLIINDKNHGILSIKGQARENIRRNLYSQIYIFSQAPELYFKNFMNYTLMGPAGAGKTKIASVIAYMYNHLGLLASDNKFLIVTRADLVGGYVGHTAIKTRDYLAKILEGVLLVDEAYQLSGCPDSQGNFGSKDYGAEAITEIVNYIDKHIGLSVIIAAGYEDKIINCFLGINEGMSRRFPNNLRLLSYSGVDLYDILETFMVEKLGSNPLNTSQSQYIQQLITILNQSDVNFNNELLFSNQAGDMLNLSTYILEDLLSDSETEYGMTEINLSFQKFFANKGIYIDFSRTQTGGQSDIQPNHIVDIYQKLQQLTETNTETEQTGGEVNIYEQLNNMPYDF